MTAFGEWIMGGGGGNFQMNHPYCQGTFDGGGQARVLAVDEEGV